MVLKIFADSCELLMVHRAELRFLSDSMITVTSLASFYKFMCVSLSLRWLLKHCCLRSPHTQATALKSEQLSQAQQLYSALCAFIVQVVTICMTDTNRLSSEFITYLLSLI